MFKPSKYLKGATPAAVITSGTLVAGFAWSVDYFLRKEGSGISSSNKIQGNSESHSPVQNQKERTGHYFGPK